MWRAGGRSEQFSAAPRGPVHPMNDPVRSPVSLSLGRRGMAEHDNEKKGNLAWGGGGLRVTEAAPRGRGELRSGGSGQMGAPGWGPRPACLSWLALMWAPPTPKLSGPTRTCNILWAVCGMALSRGRKMRSQQPLSPASQVPWPTRPDTASLRVSNTGLTPAHLLCTAGNICMAI